MNSYQKPGFLSSIPPVSRNIIIINVLVWLACQGFKPPEFSLVFHLALFPVQSGYFRLYQLVTFMFTQAEIGHLFFNMFAVFMFGRVIEVHWGAKRFLIYYMVCGIGSGLIQLLVCHLTGSSSPTIGASGAVFGILLAFGMMFPNVPLMLIFLPIPIKAKYFVILYGVVELILGFGNFGNDNIAHFAHLGGMLFGGIMILYWGRNHYNSPLDKLKNLFKKPVRKMNITYGGNRKSDYEYNAGKNQENAEIDRILEKIKQSGYNCLTEEEKKKLFDASKR